MKEYPDIYEREHGMMPVAVIDKPLSNRMASTVRHNRARGSHDVDLMSNIVKELHELGLKQISGLAALFKDVNFGQAWKPIEDMLREDEKNAQEEEK